VPNTLLLADDSVTIQRVIELTFADEDVNVVAVSDGDQAIERLESSPPDIVLADIGMPGKNGYEVAQYIKQSPHLSHIPVVLLTGAFEPVDQARAAAAGCDGVLAKPFEPQLVIGRVKELLARPKAPVHFATDLDANLAAPLVDRSSAAPAPPVSADPPDMSNYFDRLDAAFANLTPGSPRTAVAEDPPPDPAPAAAPQVHDEIDWFGLQLAPPASETPEDLPLSSASSESAFEVPPAPPALQLDAPASPVVEVEAPRPEPVPDTAREVTNFTEAPVDASAEEPAPVAPALPAKPIVLPPLADAFAALLAAEHGDAATAPVAWPATAPSTDALVDQISRRVFDQVFHQIATRVDPLVRDAVRGLVSDVAERLITEEIERIKASIK
jgi:CheY-like chemotaxis protein